MCAVQIQKDQRACSGFELSSEKGWMLREKRSMDGLCYRAKNILRCACYSGSFARDVGEYGRCVYYDDSLPDTVLCTRPEGPVPEDAVKQEPREQE